MSKRCIWCGKKANIGFAGVGYYCPTCDEDLEEGEVNDMTVFEKITNGDKIRQMSNRELADYLSSTDVNACMRDRDYCKEETWKCDKCWLEWLNSEVESE